MKKYIDGRGNKNAYAMTQYALMLLDDGRTEEAREYLMRALKISENALTCFCLAAVCSETGDPNAVRYALNATKASKNNISYVRGAMKVLRKIGAFGEMLGLYESLDEKTRSDGRVKLLAIAAYVGVGSFERADEMLNENGGA